MTKGISKFASKVSKIKRTADVDFYADDGEKVTFKVESFGQSTLREINSKYDEMMPPVPTKRVPAKGGKTRIIEFPEDKAYAKKVGEIRAMNVTELALNFLVEEDRPEGTIDEQLQAMSEVEFAGFTSKIMSTGFDISGLSDDEDEDEDEIEEAKND